MSCNHPLNRSITYFGPRSIDFREKIQIFPKIFDSFENFGLRIFWSKNTSWSQTASNHLKTPKIGFLRKIFCPPPMSRVWPQKIGRPPQNFLSSFWWVVVWYIPHPDRTYRSYRAVGQSLGVQKIHSMFTEKTKRRQQSGGHFIFENYWVKVIYRGFITIS